ncbi:MAG: hypothetical protein F4121_10940 [Acidimicrobiia bacterium]|nr:hypothetical protein [Acidimicrobiia bacterium]MYC44645.1 hypothetical protein [Acidimicrobiia bacterium]MYI20560.1 hypothetical protein [Acidimicrobiia bacterium]
MLPPATAAELNALGHDAIGVAEAGLAGRDDATVYETAVEQQRLVVTENVADFATITKDRLAAGETSVPVVFVRKHQHSRGSALAPALARHLHRWATENPKPYPGAHWP